MKLTNLLLAAALTGAALAAQAGGVAHAAEHTSILGDDFQALSVGPGGDWGWQSAAYAECDANPGDAKLDHLTTDALSTDQGYLTITATPRPDGLWDTGLITTGDSCDSGGNLAEVRTGDAVLAHVRMPDAGSGAWPAMWTWRDGGNELDIFEWHSDRPDALELANHVAGSSLLFDGPGVGPGKWLYIGAELGADNVVWLVGTDPDDLTVAYEDHVGVGPDFASYPVLSLSVSDGRFHAPPADGEPFTLGIESFVIIRPDPSD